MVTELLLITALLCAAILPIVAVWRRVTTAESTAVRGIVLIWLVFPLAVILAVWPHREPLTAVAPASYRPVEVESHGYVGSAACQMCHPHHHATWSASYHRTMTQVATAETVIAPFDHARFEAQGLTFRLQRQEGEVWAAMEMPGGQGSGEETIELYRPIALTTGSHHMQILWFPLREDTRLLGMFPFVYLKEQQRWIPRGAAFLQPDFALSDEIGRWNQTCIACHTTFGRLRPARKVDPRSRQPYLDPNLPDSQVAEFGISCEACHGPGAAHVATNRDPARRYAKHWSGEADPTIVQPERLEHRLKSQVCGQCHSVFCLDSTEAWWTNGFDYRPGDDLEQSKMRFIVRVGAEPDAKLQQVLRTLPNFVEDHFWSDGMVRISGREYNGLLESACYQRGQLSCLSCHRLHQDVNDDRSPQQWADDQLHAGMRDDLACLQCHESFRAEAALTEHTHHLSKSAGSRCYNCHMAYTTYGLLKAIRSHQIDTPSVATSLHTGRPNACNQCHLDKTLAWTATQLANWYDVPVPDLSADEQSIAASLLWLLRGDAGQRALMAWSFGWQEARVASGTDWMAPHLAQLLEDPYAAVRFIAERSLRTLPGQDVLEYDFLSSPADQAAAHTRAREIWSSTRAQPNSALLIDAQGNLMQADLQRLLDQRDNRPLTLVE